MALNTSLVMVLLYLMIGLGFGQGLVLLLVGESSELPLVAAAWLAAVILLRGNYLRLTK